MWSLYSIYGYKEKSTGRFWYVGQSVNVAKRHASHKNPIRRTNRPRFDWILTSRPNDFELVVLKHSLAESSEANYWENYHIIANKSWYGYGAHGHNFEFAKVKPTPEKIELLRRARISAFGRNRRHSPETKLKMSLARKGWVPSESMRQKLRQLYLGKPSPNLGRKASPELRAKLSAAHMGQKRGPMPEATKEKLRIAAFVKTVAWG